MKFSYSFVQVVTLLLSLSPSVEGFTRSRNDACKPNHPFRPLPPSQPRTKTCHVVSNGHGKDDSKNIMKALHKCNNGGKVVFDPWSLTGRLILGEGIEIHAPAYLHMETRVTLQIIMRV